MHEQAQDFRDPEVHHRHLSHLFGLFPGHTITMEKDPDLCRAADYTLYKRGQKINADENLVSFFPFFVQKLIPVPEKSE